MLLDGPIYTPIMFRVLVERRSLPRLKAARQRKPDWVTREGRVTHCKEKHSGSLLGAWGSFVGYLQGKLGLHGERGGGQAAVGRGCIGTIDAASQIEEKGSRSLRAAVALAPRSRRRVARQMNLQRDGEWWALNASVLDKCSPREPGSIDVIKRF